MLGLLLSRRKITFGVIGFVVFAIGLLLQTAFQNAGAGVVPAFTLQLFITLVISYDLNRRFTWGDRAADAFTTVKFFVSRLIVLAICWGLFVILTVTFRMHFALANAATVAVGMGINYLAGDRWTFVEAPPWFTTRFGRILSGEATWPRHVSRAKWLGAAVVAAFLAVRYGIGLLPAILVLTAVLSTVQVLFQIYWRTYTTQNPADKAARRFPEPRQDPDDPVSFSILAPAKEEPGVIRETLLQLTRQTWPRTLTQVLPTLRHDQPETIAEARRAEAAAPDMVAVQVNEFAETEKKSAQMNRVLPLVTGEYTSLVDAESIMAANLLRHVDALIRETDADVVIAPVQLTNLDTKTDGPWWKRKVQYATSGWFAVHNALEYRYWFSGQMFYQQDLGFTPLPGNSVFIRSSLLREAGGWDDDRLTEDADLGLRLCVDHGAKVVARYSPELATREHTPPQIWGKGGMYRQRRRWDQGFWQILRDGRWLKLATVKQRLMAGYILATPLLQAVNGLVLVPSVIAAITLKMPVPLTLGLFVPLAFNGFVLLNQLFELRDFGRDMHVVPKLRHYVSLVLGYLPYQGILGLAAVDSVRREAAGITTWDGTSRSESLHASSLSALSILND